MIDALRNWWAGLDVDSLVAYGFVATLILLAAIFPKAFRRSLLRWFGEPPPPPDDVQHRIGGYPNEIQTECMWLACEHLARNLPEPQWRAEIPPALERAAKAWRLLLQIDSDPGLKMNFGDGGRLYVFIREQDARRADFSQTVSLWQTY